MTAQAWRAFYIDEHGPLEGFMPWERELYGQVTRPGDRILIVGAGSGRDMLPFLERGHQVVGIEPAHEPAETLRQLLASSHHSAEIIEGFIEHALIPGTFDLVIFSWLCYTYMHQASRRIEALKRVAHQLNPDGRIALTDIAAEPARQDRAIRLTQWIARVTGSDWVPEKNDVLKNERNSAGERALTYEHWFVPGEVEQEARGAGLRVISTQGPVGIPVIILGGQGGRSR